MNEDTFRKAANGVENGLAHLHPDNGFDQDEYRARLVADRVRNGTWLNAQNFPPLEWAVPYLLPEGYAVLVAPPKAGKSWFAAGIGLACADGGHALGHLTVDRRPCLYFALEDGHRRLQSRFRQITGRDYIPRNMNVVVNAANLTEVVAIAETFQDTVHDAGGAPPLIIVDTLGKVNPARATNQSAYGADYAVGSQLQALAKRVPGSTVLAIHHTNKGSHADALDSVSGTQGVAGAADAVLILKRARQSNDAVLMVTGRDISNETEYALVSRGGSWEINGATLSEAEAKAGEVRAAQADASFNQRHGGRTTDILAAARTACSDGGSVTAADLADNLELSVDIVGKYLRRLHKQGLLERVQRGSYKPVSEVSEVSYSQVKAQKESDNASNQVSEVSEVSDNVSEVSDRKRALTSTTDTTDTSDTTSKADQPALVIIRNND